MTKIPMNKLTAKTITLEETNELLAAVESIKLWQMEIERAEEARKKADKYLEQLIAKSLKQSSLKFLEGELIALPEYHKMFCYLHEDFISIPVSEEYINEGIL
jgi:hypothetical protein